MDTGVKAVVQTDEAEAATVTKPVMIGTNSVSAVYNASALVEAQELPSSQIDESQGRIPTSAEKGCKLPNSDSLKDSELKNFTVNTRAHIVNDTETRDSQNSTTSSAFEEAAIIETTELLLGAGEETNKPVIQSEGQNVQVDSSRNSGKSRDMSHFSAILISASESGHFDKLNGIPHDPEVGSPNGAEGKKGSSKLALLISMTTEQKLTIITFCICNFVVAAFYSLLAPFFPGEAAKKGASPVAVGVIFGVFQATIGISSPILGSYITEIGARFMYATGVIVCGVSAILFGFLDIAPDGATYVILCLVVRFFEGLGASAFYTSSFAIVAFVFPENVAMIFGSLELFTGLGLMVGPVIGGGLFELGGFRLPFISLGGLVTVIGGLSTLLLPNHAVRIPPSEGSVWGIVKMPVVLIISFCLIAGTAAIGFLDVTLSTFLKQTYNLSEILVGFMFLVYSTMYATTAPIWGYLSDKYSHCSLHFVGIGFALAGFSLIMMGPVPFAHIPHMLWLQILSSVILGMGLGTIVLSFPVYTEAAVSKGYPDSLSTYGLTSGIFNACFSFGACAGPLIGGYLVEFMSFESAAACVGAWEMSAAFILFIYIAVKGGFSCQGIFVGSTIPRRTSRLSLPPDSVEATEHTLLLGSPATIASLHRRKT